MKRMLMIFLLLALVCQAAQKTVVVYVNGINTTPQDAEKTRVLLETRWNTYVANKGIPNNVVFDWSYNQNTWLMADLAEATRQLFGQYGTDLVRYYNDPVLVASANDKDLRQLAATEINTPGSQMNQIMLTVNNSTPVTYNEAVLVSAINRMSSSDRTDLASLVTKLKIYIATGNKTVCLGHSQGNFFCNLAYQVIQKDFAGTYYALPNNNVLEVISVATPASYTADGRFQYIKYCRDVINMVPYSLNANYKSPSELAPCMPRSTSFTGNLVTGVAGMASIIINGAGVREHSMTDSYMAPGSNLFNQVMMLIENSLPQSGCGDNINCFLKDDFRSADYTSNWVVTSPLSSSQATVKTQSGIMTLNSYLTHDPSGDPGARQTVRTRRVFTGLFTASFSIKHIGRMQSTVRLKKAIDDSTVLSLVINTPQNFVTVYPSSSATLPTVSGFTDWRQISFVRKDTQVFLMVDGNSKAFTTANAMDGYYLEFDSQGDNIMQVKDLSVVKKSTIGTVTIKTTNDIKVSCQLTGFTGPILAPTNAISVTQGSITLSCAEPTGYTISSISPNATQDVVAGQNTTYLVNLIAVNPVKTLNATCSASPAIITAGQKTVFTGSSTGGTGTKTGVWGGVVSGSATTATYISSVSAPAGFGKATYTVTDSGSPKQTVTANCQVQINAPVVTPPTNLFSETFDSQYSSRWTYTAASGNPSVTWSAGDLKIRAPRSGSSARFDSIQTFSGNVDTSFTFNHQGYGRTSVYLTSASGGQPLVGADLDTNDTAYLNFGSGSQSTQYKYNSAPYMNRKVVIRIAISGATVKFYVDGTLMENMPFSGIGPYRLMFAVGSVSWKSGDNITDFYGVTAQAETTIQVPTALALSSVSVSPNPTTTGLVRITANSAGVTSATTMELTGPYCTPCVLSVKVSQTATALVMDAQLNNPGTFTVKLRDGSQLTVGKDFTVTVPSSPTTFTETFQTNYPTNWNMTVGSGNPLTVWEPGRLRVQASKSGASASFISKQAFTGPLTVEFAFTHYNYGRTSVSILPASGDQRLASVDLDTDDCNYLNFSVPGKSTDWKYAGNSYLNRKVVIRMVTSASTVQFFVDGTLMETMPFSGTGTYRLMFSVGSVSWKSGDNITDFYGATATTETLTIPPSPPPGSSNSVELSKSPLFTDSTLLAYYRFEGNSTDSKAGHNGSDTSVSYGTNYGKFGQGASFSNGRINTGSWNIPTAFSISSWVYLNSLADVQSIFSNYNGEGTSSNVVQLFASTGDGSVVYCNFVVDSGASTTKLTANTWHHVAITHNGSVVKIYINGVLDHQSNVPHTSSTRTNSIGKRGDGYQPLNGRLDDLAIFGRELTASEISGLYAGGGGVSATGGTVSVSTTNNLGVGCTLNNVSITAPTTLSSKPTGSYTLACTAPSGYSIVDITPSPTQTLSAGGTVNFNVGLKTTTVVPLPLSNVSCSVSSISVQTGTQVTYTANWSGGSGSPGFNWAGHVSGTTRSVSKSFDSPGTYTASVLVMDNGQQLTGQCSNVMVTAPPPSLSVSWFWYSPESPKTTDNTITLNFSGTGFNSSTQVWVFGLNCASGCQAGVVASSVTSSSMKALAQLRNVDNFQIKLRNGSSGDFVSAGTVPVR